MEVFHHMLKMDIYLQIGILYLKIGIVCDVVNMMEGRDTIRSTWTGWRGQS